MTKIRIEWSVDGAGKFRETRCEVGYSRRGNHYCKHENQVYVWHEQRVGEPVLSKVDGKGKWTIVGRVTGSGLFIGPSTELSYFEWSRTAEGRAKLEQDFQLLRNDLVSFHRGL